VGVAKRSNRIEATDGGGGRTPADEPDPLAEPPRAVRSEDRRRAPVAIDGDDQLAALCGQ
jgi:hypothetical protein